MFDETFVLSTALKNLETPEGPSLQRKNLILQLKAEALIKIADAGAAEEAINALKQVFSLIKCSLRRKHSHLCALKIQAVYFPHLLFTFCVVYTAPTNYAVINSFTPLPLPLPCFLGFSTTSFNS